MKIDILINGIDGKRIQGGLGVQVTTRDDSDFYKANVAKLNALKVCARFIFLILNDSELDYKTIGDDLKKLFYNLIREGSWGKAILIKLSRNGDLIIHTL